MNYMSTRGFSEPRTFEDVVLEGAAPDGGLYLPAMVPEYCNPPVGARHADYVAAALEAFGATAAHGLVRDAFSRFHHEDVAPIREIGPFHVMEMFWGPTLSFKDHALQVLARLFDRFLAGRAETRTILVATSGDTGSAAIEAFRGLESVRIVVLYPIGLVSDFQRRQMTTVGAPNVSVVGVAGTFDDCQRLVKEAFTSQPGLASANSINWGRLAAQAGYYLSLAARIDGPFDVIIPTGNFGNAFSARLAVQLGAQIRRITIATNSNRTLYELFQNGVVKSDAPIATLAPAMDIQVPSNLERYLSDHSPADFAVDFNAGWADDTTILQTIKEVFETHGYLIDPHTAAAWAVAKSTMDEGIPHVVVSTAHPAKFGVTIEEAVGFAPEVPGWADMALNLPEHQVEIGSNFTELAELL